MTQFLKTEPLPPGYLRISHGFAPVCDEYSRILILGSFPSVKSRQQQFYYGHPQNRFWRLLALVFRDSLPISIDEKKEFLLSHQLALWDVIDTCDIKGSSDSSIRNVIPSDLSRILHCSPIETILANGNTAFRLYRKYCEGQTGRKAIRCPSTSPANAAFTLERLATSWAPHLLSQSSDRIKDAP